MKSYIPYSLMQSEFNIIRSDSKKKTAHLSLFPSCANVFELNLYGAWDSEC
jgi:hypothetical protein